MDQILNAGDLTYERPAGSDIYIVKPKPEVEETVRTITRHYRLRYARVSTSILAKAATAFGDTTPFQASPVALSKHMFEIPSWLYIIPVLGFLVFVHELGHFATAKWFGIKVTEFGFGFPPRLFGFRYGETTYTLNLIPPISIETLGRDPFPLPRLGDKRPQLFPQRQNRRRRPRR